MTQICEDRDDREYWLVISALPSWVQFNRPAEPGFTLRTNCSDPLSGLMKSIPATGRSAPADFSNAENAIRFPSGDQAGPAPVNCSGDFFVTSNLSFVPSTLAV